DVYRAYMLAWELGCKGLTVYVTGSRSEVVLETKATADKKSSTNGSTEEAIEPMETVFMFNEEKEPRPTELMGRTYRTLSPAGTAYVTINENDKYDNQPNQPFEIFINTSKAGSEIAAISEAMGRLISLILRMKSPVSPRDRLTEVARQLTGIGAGRQMGFGPNRIASFPDAIAQILSRYLNHAETFDVNAIPTNGNGHHTDESLQPQLPLDAANGNGHHATETIGDICPDCGAATLMKEEGCVSCHSCGYAEC
ncbi:MAG: ribonucleoside-diphosphate reductase, adenosylcobalamin-dependent, partial [Chloroflexota bacterium]